MTDERDKKLTAYRCLFDWKETELLDHSTDGNFHFFQGETHSNAVARSCPEPHEGVGTPIGLVLGTPPKKNEQY